MVFSWCTEARRVDVCWDAWFHIWCYRLQAECIPPCLQVSAELGSQWNNVIAPQDIALYGGLCALAYLDRRELQEQVIDNVQFREYLETYPEVSRDQLFQLPRP